MEPTDESALGRIGGWLESRRPRKKPSPGLSELLPGVGTRRGPLPGTGRPMRSELKVRDTESRGESGRLWFLDVAPATSSAHWRRSASVDSSLLAVRCFSRSVLACSRAVSVDLCWVLRVASCSRQLSSSCCAVASAGLMSCSSSSRRLQRLA